jgi:hypothetical protein
MKRLLTAAAASLLLTLALVAPVGAADPAGPGCSDFGAATAGLAHSERPFGQLVSGVARGEPGGASWLIQAEHRGDIGTYPCAKP